jgi:hypothetical protein
MTAAAVDQTAPCVYAHFSSLQFKGCTSLNLIEAENIIIGWNKRGKSRGVDFKK